MPEIDLYCERTMNHWFDEPFGLVSNLCFIVAAIHQMSRSGHSIETKSLTGLLLAIGIGSGLFHAFATQATLLMDVIPIQLFIVSAIWILLRAHIGLGAPLSVLTIIAVMGTSALMPRDLLNGSAGYLPPFVALMSIAFVHARGRAKALLWRASILFPISVTFRSLDNVLCVVIPIGTHFVWHGLNALVLWYIIEAVRQHSHQRFEV